MAEEVSGFSMIAFVVICSCDWHWIPKTFLQLVVPSCLLFSLYHGVNGKCTLKIPDLQLCRTVLLILPYTSPATYSTKHISHIKSSIVLHGLCLLNGPLKQRTSQRWTLRFFHRALTNIIFLYVEIHIYI